MRQELAHYNIDEALGGSQEWFVDPFMKLGGCGAVTACDTCIWLAREVEGAEWLYPFDPAKIAKADFLHFGKMMKPYLRPRAGGINRLELFMRGFGAYLRGREEMVRQAEAGEEAKAGCNDVLSRGRKILRMSGFSGHESADRAWDELVRKINEGFPVPMLMLRHQNPELKDLVWHWFLLIGYSDEEGAAGEAAEKKAGRKVKVVTYGETAWIDFDRLWDTGYEQKGGLILYRWEE